MSGILGIWNEDGRPLDPVLLAKMSETLAHRGSDYAGVWSHGPVGLACRLSRVTPESSSETQPVAHASGVVLVFDGRLDNRDDLITTLGATSPLPTISLHSPLPDSTLVIQAYDAYGDRFVEHLQGDFALGLYDPGQQRLMLVRDALGVRPLYYIKTRDTFLFASEVKALLAHPQVTVHPNEDALASFLLGSAQDTEGLTCFDGVASLPPATMGILKPQGFTTHRYWDFDLSAQIRFQSFSEYAEGFRDRFERAVRRRLRSSHPVAVSVSGGLDSSSIYCLGETLRRTQTDLCPSLLGVSYLSPQGSPSDEQPFLESIEQNYGLGIERVIGHPESLDGSTDTVWYTEVPLLDEQWHNTLAVLETARSRGARLLLTGHWGDQILFPLGYLTDLTRRLKWGVVRTHLREICRWHTDLDPSALWRALVLGLVRSHIPEWAIGGLRHLRHRTRHRWYADSFRRRAFRGNGSNVGVKRQFPTAHVRSLYEAARSPYYAHCLEWNNKVAALTGMEIAFPFLDRDLIAYLMAIPGEVPTWNGVPKALLRESLQGVLPDAIARRTWKADFSQIVNAAVTQKALQLMTYLYPDGSAIRMGYLKGDLLGQELPLLADSWQGPTCEPSWRLSKLLGLEIWLRVFLEGNRERRAGVSSCLV